MLPGYTCIVSGLLSDLYCPEDIVWRILSKGYCPSDIVYGGCCTGYIIPGCFTEANIRDILSGECGDIVLTLWIILSGGYCTSDIVRNMLSGYIVWGLLSEGCCSRDFVWRILSGGYCPGDIISGTVIFSLIPLTLALYRILMSSA